MELAESDSIFSLLKAYTYAALLSSGPWVISIIAILLIGFVNILTLNDYTHTIRFQIIVTYAFAMAASLVITGGIQLPFTRYISDLIFDHQEEKILPVFFGTLFVLLTSSAIIIVPLTFFLFSDRPPSFAILVASTFLTLCLLWIANILAASLKLYRHVLFSYFVAYGIIAILAIAYGYNTRLLLLSFLIGNLILFGALTTMIIYRFPSKELFSFDFFKQKHFYFSLALAGLFYNLGTWIDKFIFWYHPLTGEIVIGKLRASVAYDLPIFLAYLSIIPGIAIFFFRLETAFALNYHRFFDAIRNGGTLALIYDYKDNMVRTIRLAIREIIVIQGIVDIFIFLYAPAIFKLLNIPQLYLGLFYIDTIGAELQLAFMAMLAMLYYMDRQSAAMWLSLVFLVLNASLSLLTIYMGPATFGYGYAVSLLVSFIASLVVIRRTMERIEYETFMLQ